MKKLFFLLSVLCLHSSLSATVRYFIFKFAGDVKLKSETIWQPVKQRQKIDLRDYLLIGKQSMLGILDSKTNRVYYTEKEGKYTVAQIIGDARRQADKVTGLVNNQIRVSLNSGHNYKLQVAGASYRGEGADEKLQQVYAALYQAFEGFRTGEVAGRVTAFSVEKVLLDGDDTFYFRINNISKLPLYVNILCCDSSQASLAFNLGYTCNEPYLLVAPNEILDVSQFVFATNTNCFYVPFATEFPIDTQTLQLLLQRGMPIMSVESDTLDLYWGNNIK